MHTSTTVAVAVLLFIPGLLLAGCQEPSTDSNTPPAEAKAPADTPPGKEKPAAAQAKTPSATDAKSDGAKGDTADKDGPVFDPANPPKGYSRCHRGHCHHESGKVASYATIMKEMGATTMVGGKAIPKMPAAPPDVAKPPKEAEVTSSGLASKVLTKGTGTTHPKPTDKVQVHYTGWTTDGKAFDSSVARGRPIVLPLNRVIPGWTEGIQLMVEGEERRFWIPEELAYKGRPGSPAGMLVFDVNLIAIQK
ncbi:MAG: FKBP-type peptidyl-prolyl cis-trans isomerase [Myxococcota bacterium]